MKLFLKYAAPVFAILWLAKVHPLGAVVAVLLCLVRCAFRSQVFSHLFALFIHDIVLTVLKWMWSLLFSRRPS